MVTFGNGLVARELIVDLDDTARRLWVADLLPDAMAGTIRGMIEQGMAVMKKTLEA